MLLTTLKEHKAEFGSVVPFDASTDVLLPLDFTESNTELTEDILLDTVLFSKYINCKLSSANAKYGIGGYAEHRTIYSRSTVFNTAENEEPRRLHLGIDIWGKPFTPVKAPLQGMVHSFAFNNAFGDYGATIILNHKIEDVVFYTLYGHLSLASIKNLRGGEKIDKGEVFAEFGIPQENGSWPPHLHFQIIEDVQQYKGDYPGVCKYSERATYLSNCPDPDLILNMMQYATAE